MTGYRFAVDVMPREGILDPQGRAVENALPQLDATNVHQVRVGRRIELTVEAEDAATARRTVEKLAADFLANPLVERWAIEELAAVVEVGG
jgi:phosphoribosylformylglycinamidine synthase